MNNGTTNSEAAEGNRDVWEIPCAIDECSPLRKRGLRVRTSQLAYRAAYVTSICLTLAYSMFVFLVSPKLVM